MKEKRIVPAKPGLFVPNPRKGPGVPYPPEGIVAVPTPYDLRRKKDGSLRFEDVVETAATQPMQPALSVSSDDAKTESPDAKVAAASTKPKAKPTAEHKEN